MNHEEIAHLLMRRCAMARHPMMRLWLAIHVELQRIHAHWLAHGADFTKRLLDIAVALFLLALACPLLLVIAILIKLEDRGPVFFAQTRIGQDGREFKMFKVRSMVLGAEQKLSDLLGKNKHHDGVTFKIQDDPRITSVGKWLRKFSFDELPQLYNVLIGDMSLVGPRPPLPREVAKYSLADRRRLSVKPGITCIWQISGRANIDFSGQVQLDVDYIEGQSIWTDLLILTRTVPAVLSGKGAC
ncbi:MAG TPA: sugar transferase [Verrucomicrobiae bacterium]|jgi:lipopolysaccharide/colanic/teichoic acid biosynthesis glycosyltransferase